MILVMLSSFQNICILEERTVCPSPTESECLVWVWVSHFLNHFLRERNRILVEHLPCAKHRFFTSIALNLHSISPHKVLLFPSPLTHHTTCILQVRKCRIGELRHMPRVLELGLISSKHVYPVLQRTIKDSLMQGVYILFHIYLSTVHHRIIRSQ